MATPASVLAYLASLAAGIANYVGEAVGLGQLFSMSQSAGGERGTFFRFVNNYLRFKSGATKQDAYGAYPYAKFYANQGEYLSQLNPGDVPDKKYAFEVYKDKEDFIPGQNYRYTVRVDITFPSTGETKSFYRVIYTPFPSALDEAYGDALNRLYESFRDGSLPQSEGGQGEELDVSFQLVQFAVVYSR